MEGTNYSRGMNRFLYTPFFTFIVLSARNLIFTTKNTWLKAIDKALEQIVFDRIMRHQNRISMCTNKRALSVIKRL